MRDNFWLKTKLEYIWEKYFSDVERLNTVEINFGKKAKRRLASIRQLRKDDKHSDTQIRVTSFYKDPQVPEFVVETTIAHELCHYTHGFASPHPQYFSHPHRGDVVDTELCKRGLEEKLRKQEIWLKENWNNIVGQEIFAKRIHSFSAPKPKRRKKRMTLLKFIQNLGYN